MRRTLALAAVALAACAGGGQDVVLVSAAASLTDVFEEIALEFEEAHPGTDVVLNIGGSSGLRTQILEGAPADVFASADTLTMDDVVETGRALAPPVVFATNSLVIVVPAGNPGEVGSLGDFADAGRFLGLCAAEVPCGRSARAVFAAAGVTPAPDTEEPDVRALLTKVAAGELDAGVVYRTDVPAVGGRVESIAIPASVDVEVRYPIVPLSDAGRPFVRFVLSNGEAVLARHGFGAP